MLIPDAALDSHLGVLGKTGSGKSNLAKVMAEILMDRGERVCAIDPTGTWWGLRVLKSGKPSRFKPVIFGGEHADVPITDQHGSVVAEAIGTSSDSAIIDTRLMGSNARTRFFTDFAETLLRTNKGPLHLIIDEAHLFAPQGKVNSPQAGAMLAEANELVSRGRSAGLRVMLISQRPAKLHKDSLTQVETLIAMRLIAPQDRAAIEAWVGEWADAAKGKEIIASLPSLPVGDAWVWAPQLDHLERVHFPIATTFDSGRPLSRDEAAPELRPLDVNAIGEKMDAIRQEALASDPTRLKRRIVELERELHNKSSAEQLALEYRRGYEAGVEEASAALGQAVLSFAADFALKTTEKGVPAKVAVAKPATPAAPVHRPKVTHANGYSGPMLKVLRALGMWRGLGHETPTKPMVAMIAGYSHGSGNFGNLLSQLKSAGAIEYPSPGLIRLVAEGDYAMPASEAQTAFWDKLSSPQRKLIESLTAGDLTKTELGERTGYSATSGNFGNLLSQLRTLGIVDYPRQGFVALEPWAREIL